MTIRKYTDAFTPDSTAIKQAFYNRRTGELYVQFHRAGSSYAGYDEVPLSIWEGFRTATSAGKFYNAYIIDRFPGIDTPGLVLEFDGETAAEEDAFEELVNDDLVAMAPTDYSNVELSPAGLSIGDVVAIMDERGAGYFSTLTTPDPAHPQLNVVLGETVEAQVLDQEGRVQYVITYTEETADDFGIKANSEDEALVRFWKAMENVPGVIKVISITRYFDED